MRALFLIFVLLLNALLLTPVAARPGGGHSSSGHRSSSSHSSFSHGSSFSAGHSSYSGGGSSGCFGKTYCTTSDYIILLVFAIIIIAVFFYVNKGNTPAINSAPTLNNRRQQSSKLQDDLAQLKHSDPNFSGILLLDFLHSFYNKFYSYSTHPEFSYLSPFLSEELQSHFKDAEAWTINEVVINGIRWDSINTQEPESDSINFVIDANYSLHQHDKKTRYAVTERWQLSRIKGLLSPEPDKMHSLCCPKCGAPAQFTDAGLCEHCARVFHPGKKQWYLAKRAVLKTTALDAFDLVAYAEEQGTSYATIKADNLSDAMQAFQQSHGFADWNSFWQGFESDIVKTYFLNIYESWSQRNWQAVRHLLSDRLFEANQFWLALYAENNWFNRLDNLIINKIELAKIGTDAYYEAITVRIFATCNDYTEDANGKIVGGSKRKPRSYSEYWTFVRRTNAKPHTAPYSLKQCPQCGAPADNMGQSGQCGYCGSKISTGEFSWVLFLILQDDVYEG